MGKQDEHVITLPFTILHSTNMAAKQFDLLVLMKESPLQSKDWPLGQKLNTTIKSNKLLDLALGSVGSGRNVLWHCFYPVDNVNGDKQVLFVELYSELNRVMTAKPSNLNPFVMDKQWEYVDFPVKLGDTARRYACSNLVVFARTYLDPKYGSMPADFLDCLRAVMAEATPVPQTPPPQPKSLPSRHRIRGGKLPRTPEPNAVVAPVQKRGLRKTALPTVAAEPAAAPPATGPAQPAPAPPATAPPQPPPAPPATVPKKRKAKQYEEGDFQYEQPTYGGSLQPVVKRSREWFAIHHPKVKVEREDPFPEARKLSKAEQAALVASGAAAIPKEKRAKGEAGSRQGCALNNFLNLEKQNRTGKCNYYKDYVGRKEGVVHVKAPVKCATCKVGLHEECYFTYHEIMEGVVLDLGYEINLVRRAHKSVRKWPRKPVWIKLRRVQPDLHSGVEVPGNHSQDDREKGESESETDNESSHKEGGADSC